MADENTKPARGGPSHVDRILDLLRKNPEGLLGGDITQALPDIPRTSIYPALTKLVRRGVLTRKSGVYRALDNNAKIEAVNAALAQAMAPTPAGASVRAVVEWLNQGVQLGILTPHDAFVMLTKWSKE